MQLTDCFNIYRTHLHGIEENKDKLQGIFDLHVSLWVFFSYDVSFFRFYSTVFPDPYLYSNEWLMYPIFPKCALKWEFQFNLLLSPYPCFISLLYLDLYVLGDDALIS